MLKIRRPLGRLIFNMGIAIPGKTVFLIETAPWTRHIFKFHWNFLPDGPNQQCAALVYDCRRRGENTLSELILLTDTCVTWPRWVRYLIFAPGYLSGNGHFSFMRAFDIPTAFFQIMKIILGNLDLTIYQTGMTDETVLLIFTTTKTHQRNWDRGASARCEHLIGFIL